MRTLEQALFDHELITLRVIGEWWELDLTGADKVACVKALAATLAQLDMLAESSYLPPEEASALLALAAAGGQIPLGTFSRQHGEVRLMGPGRLEREEPWFDPVSAAEALWYRGFLYRAFDETSDGLVEFYYLPTELNAQFAAAIPAGDTPAEAPTLEAVTPPDSYLASDLTAVDDLTTLLAFAQRRGLAPGRQAALAPYLLTHHPGRVELLVTLAVEMQHLRPGDDGLKPARPAVDWLQKGREAQLRDLAAAWRTSAWNDLCHTPGLACEGSGWANDPLAARQALLNHLPRNEQWYHLSELIALVKEADPDFQRPDGNYDTWYVRDLASEAFITGFSNWDLVEGRLLRYLVQGPLSWLGLVETGDAERFRLTPRALAWLADQPPAGAGVEVPPVVQPDASVLVPHNANRYQRFQVARICDARPVSLGKPYTYQLSPSSLAYAREQGINPDRVLQFLEKASGRPIPASTRRAVERWAENGREAQLQQVIILRVRDGDILDKLVANPKTRPYLGERLGDLAVTVLPNNWQELQNVAAQLGLLLDIVSES